ncbi:hypothetical protein [Spirosoma gilvum]
MLHAAWSPYLFGILTIVGLALLVKSVAKLIHVYTDGPRIEWMAQSPIFDFDLAQAGSYEISVKRASVFGRIPTSTAFRVSDRQNGQSIPIAIYGYLTSKRTDLSGNRIIPIADFTINQPGSFRLHTPDTNRFIDQDKLVLSPKAGIMGVLMILGTVCSSVLSIASLVLFTLSLINS